MSLLRATLHVEFELAAMKFFATSVLLFYSRCEFHAAERVRSVVGFRMSRVKG